MQVQALRAFVKQYPTQQAAAKALKISGAYLCDLLYGRRNYPDWLLTKLGLKRIVVKR